MTYESRENYPDYQAVKVKVRIDPKVLVAWQNELRFSLNDDVVIDMLQPWAVRGIQAKPEYWISFAHIQTWIQEDDLQRSVLAWFPSSWVLRFHFRHDGIVDITRME